MIYFFLKIPTLTNVKILAILPEYFINPLKAVQLLQTLGVVALTRLGQLL